MDLEYIKDQTFDKIDYTAIPFSKQNMIAVLLLTAIFPALIFQGAFFPVAHLPGAIPAWPK